MFVCFMFKKTNVIETCKNLKTYDKTKYFSGIQVNIQTKKGKKISMLIYDKIFIALYITISVSL